MQVVTQIFSVISAVINNFVTAISSTIASVTSIFYTADDGFSFVGVLLLVAAGAGIVYWAFRFIRRLVKGVL